MYYIQAKQIHPMHMKLWVYVYDYKSGGYEVSPGTSIVLYFL